MQKILLSIVFYCIFYFSSNVLKGQCSASFSHDSIKCTGKNVSFSADSVVIGLSYEWDFGDPSSGFFNTDTSQAPKHLYSKRGTYNVRLIVSSVSGCNDTVIKSITVYTTPIAQFSYVNACAGLQTLFENKTISDSIDKIKTYFWNFESGINSSAANPS
ncbi:MAG: PKD domain-containing protein, partial [Bacteroidota bacterium]